MSRAAAAATLVVVLALATGVGGPRAGAADYAASGLALAYPDGWVLATQADSKLLQGSPSPMRRLFTGLDFRHISLCVARPPEDEFCDNVNLVIESEEVALTEETRVRANSELPLMYAPYHISPTGLAVKLETIGANRTLSARWDIVIPGDSRPLTQWQVHIPGGGKTYVFTCSAPQARFARVEPAFRTILASVKIQRGWPAWLVTAIQVAVLCAGVALLLVLTRPKKVRP